MLSQRPEDHVIPHFTAEPERPGRPGHRPTPLGWLTVVLTSILLATVLAVPAETVAAPWTRVAACDDVSLRTSASTSATRKALLDAGASVRVVATVTGGSYWAECAGTIASGTAWFRIDAVNGTSVAALYGVSYVYGARTLFTSPPASTPPSAEPVDSPSPTPIPTPTASPAPLAPSPTPTATPAPTASPTPAPIASPTPAPTASPTPAPTPTPTPTPAPTPTPTPTPTPAPTTKIVAACGVNLRTSARSTSTRMTTLKAGTAVTVAATWNGGSWSTTCGGKLVSGSTWHRIRAINGRSVLSLYGVSYVYGASGLFKTVTVQSPPPSPPPDPLAAVFTLGSEVTFHGRGYGHGAGLSQYGTRGRAIAGQDYTSILGHYYQGATLSSVANSQVRVLVLDNFAATATKPLVIYARGGPFTIDFVGRTFPAEARIRAIPTVSGSTTTWKLVVTASDGMVLHNAATSGTFRLRPAASATRLQLYSKPSAYDRYRGNLRVSATKTVDVVNEVPLETYLRSVVPAEMPSSWPAEALKAQAVAARSYAARRLRPGVSTFDVYDDTRSQVYQGSMREASATDLAIAATAGRVLRSGTSIANTVFHSTGGGATEHNENVFVSSTGAKTAGVFSYLRGSPDRAPDGTPYDVSSPYSTWKTATYTRSQLSTWLASDSRTNVGTLVKLDLRNRGVSGRLISVTLIGSTGATKTVSGDVFRAVLNARRPAGDPLFRSNLFALTPIP